MSRLRAARGHSQPSQRVNRCCPTPTSFWRMRMVDARPFPGGSRASSNLFKIIRESVELVIGQLLETHEPCPGPLHAADKLVQLQLDRLGVPVLCVLNNEHHQEGEERRCVLMTSCHVSE